MVSNQKNCRFDSRTQEMFGSSKSNKNRKALPTFLDGTPGRYVARDGPLLLPPSAGSPASNRRGGKKGCAANQRAAISQDGQPIRGGLTNTVQPLSDADIDQSLARIVTLNNQIMRNLGPITEQLQQHHARAHSQMGMIMSNEADNNNVMPSTQHQQQRQNLTAALVNNRQNSAPALHRLVNRQLPGIAMPTFGPLHARTPIKSRSLAGTPVLTRPAAPRFNLGGLSIDLDDDAPNELATQLPTTIADVIRSDSQAIAPPIEQPPISYVHSNLVCANEHEEGVPDIQALSVSTNNNNANIRHHQHSLSVVPILHESPIAEPNMHSPALDNDLTVVEGQQHAAGGALNRDTSGSTFSVTVDQILPGFLQHQIPDWLVVYAKAGYEHDHLLNWDMFQLPQLEYYNDCLMKQYKQQVVEIVIAYEHYRLALIDEVKRRRQENLTGQLVNNNNMHQTQSLNQIHYAQHTLSCLPSTSTDVDDTLDDNNHLAVVCGRKASTSMPQLTATESLEDPSDIYNNNNNNRAVSHAYYYDPDTPRGWQQMIGYQPQPSTSLIGRGRIITVEPVDDETPPSQSDGEEVTVTLHRS